MEKDEQRGLGGGSRLARGCGPRGEDAERGLRPSAGDSGEQRRPPVAPRELPSMPASPPQPPIRAGSKLRVWRSFLLEKPLAEAAPPEAGEEQEKTLWSRLWADISAGLCLRATLFPLSGTLAIWNRERKGAQARLPGGAGPRLAEGGGGQCPAHAPPARSKCPSGCRSIRSITSLLGKEVGWPPVATRTLPQSPSGERGEEEKEEGQALSGFPAPARQRHSPFPVKAGDAERLAGSGQPRSLQQAPPRALRTVPRAGEEASRECAQGASVALPVLRERLPPALKLGARAAPGLYRRGVPAPEAVRLASPWLLRPLLRLARCEGVSKLQVPSGC